MRSGRLRHQVVIQQVTESQDASGAVVESWAALATVWASIDPIAGNEFFAAKQTMAETTHRIRIRYLSGVVPKMRVLFGSRTFDITEIINFQEKNVELQLMATETH
jgi:SPP1 family predicted phage head-tail adaptor